MSYIQQQGVRRPENIESLTATLTDAEIEDNLNIGDTSSGPITLTLPTSSADGLIGKIKRSGADDLTVAGGIGETIDGAASYVVTQDNDALEIIKGAGTDWRIT